MHTGFLFVRLHELLGISGPQLSEPRTSVTSSILCIQEA